MKIEFKNKKLKKTCEDSKKLNKEFNKQAEKIITRISELAAADNLYDISKLPQARLHPLRGDLVGCFAVDLKHPYRLIFSPLNGDVSDLKLIISIKILKIDDYH